MSIRKLSSFLLVFALLLNASAFAADGLSSRADSLKDSLTALKDLFAGRGPSFKASGGAVFKLLDRARGAAEDVQKRSGKNAPRSEVGEAIDDLRSKMEKMQGFVSGFRLTDSERVTYRSINIKYADVLRYWNNYGVAVSGPVYRPQQPAPSWQPAPAYGPGLDKEARRIAIHYLMQTYNVYYRDILVERTLNLGDRHRVIALVMGQRRAVDLNARTGRIYSVERVY
jgi:hypothetical protein